MKPILEETGKSPRDLLGNTGHVCISKALSIYPQCNTNRIMSTGLVSCLQLSTVCGAGYRAYLKFLSLETLGILMDVDSHLKQGSNMLW